MARVMIRTRASRGGDGTGIPRMKLGTAIARGMGSRIKSGTNRKRTVNKKSIRGAMRMSRFGM